MQPPPSLNRAVPRSGSSPEISLLPPSIGQARAAGAPPKAASSLSLSSSPVQRELPPNAASCLSLSSSHAQRELPPEQPPHSLYRAAPRSESSPQTQPPASLFRSAVGRCTDTGSNLSSCGTLDSIIDCELATHDFALYVAQTTTLNSSFRNHGKCLHKKRRWITQFVSLATR